MNQNQYVFKEIAERLYNQIKSAYEINKSRNISQTTFELRKPLIICERLVNLLHLRCGVDKTTNYTVLNNSKCIVFEQSNLTLRLNFINLQ